MEINKNSRILEINYLYNTSYCVYVYVFVSKNVYINDGSTFINLFCSYSINWNNTITMHWSS